MSKSQSKDDIKIKGTQTIFEELGASHEQEIESNLSNYPGGGDDSL